MAADDVLELKLMVRQLAGAVKTGSDSTLVLASKVERQQSTLERIARSLDTLTIQQETSIHALRTDVAATREETGRVRLAVDRKKEESGKVNAITRLVAGIGSWTWRTWTGAVGVILALAVLGRVLWLLETARLSR